ncbi:MAG: helix-turn-helix transcriptional regulator [Maricaulaceae bacterium]|jgi:transcriptional regulator with XRE-family HTH domain
MSDEERTPNPVDIHVGSRVRLRRLLLGLSQEKLGDELGVTFQQVQKYERGANRIGASRLYRVAKVLQVPVGFFFEGLDSVAADGFAEDDQTPLIDDFINSPEGVALASAFARIREPSVRRKLLELARTLSGEKADS